MTELTARQREILDYIVEFQRVNRFPPTVREIGARFGIKSPNGVVSHTNALIRKGFLAQSRRKCRSMTAPRTVVSLAQLGNAVSMKVQELKGGVTFLEDIPDMAWCQEIGVAVAALFGWKDAEKCT